MTGPMVSRPPGSQILRKAAARAAPTASGDELTTMQRAFCREYVANGGHGERAAIAAGFSPKTARQKASQLLRKPKVQEIIRAETFEQVERLAPRALNVLLGIIDDPEVAARDRVRAAEAILERSYLHKMSKTEVQVSHVVDPATLIAEVWAKRQARLAAAALEAPVIEGEAHSAPEGEN